MQSADERPDDDSAAVDHAGHRIELVPLEALFDLRKTVLRPWLTPEGAMAAYADGAERFHVGARAGPAPDARVVSTASFKIELPHGPGSAALLAEAGAATGDATGDATGSYWRLLSMATYPEAQGSGLGGAVLGFGVAELARRLAERGAGSAVVWCQGRTGARRFYERQGFAAVGEEFENPGTGPHFVFWRTVAAA
ncbi:GNAT family N-acetyltransferase [Pelagibius sp.]|uniref:GNAT family N-acetyltransferase n=1 Tax=Pelagibius sp. TaxID=1931238 RepID=UPI002633EE4E|nr:GNAT family N-acetyltransferase [Pelagibius sp.]